VQTSLLVGRLPCVAFPEPIQSTGACFVHLQSQQGNAACQPVVSMEKNESFIVLLHDGTPLSTPAECQVTEILIDPRNQKARKKNIQL
jgi:hypothetical protein